VQQEHLLFSLYKLNLFGFQSSVSQFSLQQQLSFNPVINQQSHHELQQDLRLCGPHLDDQFGKIRGWLA